MQNLPIGAVALLLLVFLLPSKPVTGSWKLKLKQIDWLGCALVMTSLVLILVRQNYSCQTAAANLLLLQLALSWGGVRYPWASAEVLAPLLVGVAVAVAFCMCQVKVSRIPIIPMRLFKLRNVIGVQVVAVLATGMNPGFIVFYVPQYAQIVLGLSTTRSGVLLLPYLLPITCVVLTCAMVTVKTGRYCEPIWIAVRPPYLRSELAKLT